LADRFPGATWAESRFPKDEFGFPLRAASWRPDFSEEGAPVEFAAAVVEAEEDVSVRRPRIFGNAIIAARMRTAATTGTT